jgi:hypothetical protein
MRNLGVLLCILGMPSFLSAQGKQAMWENLNALRPGQKVQIVEMNSKTESGTFLSVSGTAISLQEKDGEQTIQRQDVRTVKIPKRPNHLRNSLIGGAIGAGVGAGIGAAVYHPCENHPPLNDQCSFDIGSRGLDAAFGGVVGLVGGAVVGALLPTGKTIYRASAH